ncbi:MAG: Rha family transcriptional regulator [Candidatus Cloacimonetes bacterium]|nr:Rha family transcriptional regulator [Candidatus Cloacimonadota bacterium]
MLQELVKVKQGWAFCSSQMVAEKFGKRHRDMIVKIEKLISDFDEINKPKRERTFTPLNFQLSEGKHRGQKYKIYLMDRRSFSLLVMRFTGKKALEWQAKFNDAFYQMERRILAFELNQQSDQWLTQRVQGKLARKSETDTIKNFVEYATGQGSTKAQWYYKHLTNACYKCLQLIQHKQPKLRETLDLLELHQLMMAEIVAERSLKKWMNEKEHYKAIFVLVKQDLECFANSLILPQKIKSLEEKF